MDLVINKSKLRVFLEVAKALNREYNMVPILYGSLGLNRLIGEFGPAGDIDILVPPRYIQEDWPKFRIFIERLGFILKDEHEHEFERDGIRTAFGNEYELKTFTGIDYENLEIEELKGARFKRLNAEQYLRVYELMGRDNYRVKKRGSEDLDKLRRIREFLLKSHK